MTSEAGTLTVADLGTEIEHRLKCGYRLDSIWPADRPANATLSGPDGTIKLHCENPPTTGRAGMHYRDLVSDRLEGRLIASHIQVPGSGPVPDAVHWHDASFQLIVCLAGEVDVLYEGQGPAITLRPGDLVTQPPKIRHRVLASRDDLQVLEIAVPEAHRTWFDHNCQLPGATAEPDRQFSGQRFCHYVDDSSRYRMYEDSAFSYADTGIHQASSAVADVHWWKAATTTRHEITLPRFEAPSLWLVFVVSGSIEINDANACREKLTAGNAIAGSVSGSGAGSICVAHADNGAHFISLSCLAP